MEKIFVKDGREYWVYFDRREVFITTLGDRFVSEQICKDIMTQLNWKPLKTFMVFYIKGYRCIALGYKAPFFKNPVSEIEKIF